MSLAIYGTEPNLWHLKFWPYILPTGLIGKIYGQNLSDHKSGQDHKWSIPMATLLQQGVTPTY